MQLETTRSTSALIFIEAEGFSNTGGWVVDQQFMDIMGSPFLLAHGLGTPVADATTTVQFPETGSYRLWVRTRDWVAPWQLHGAPGRFQVLIDGIATSKTFGMSGAAWHWDDGGVVAVEHDVIELALHDLTGFEGRCDAILFSRDLGYLPPDDGPELATLRGQSATPPVGLEDKGMFDLVVAGGGIAGICAAVVAAKLGLQVALVHDRPVVGGNNSSEVRVWMGGVTNVEPYPHLGDIVKSLDQARRAHAGAENTADIYEDEKKLDVLQNAGVTLFLEYRVTGVEVVGGRIDRIIARNIIDGSQITCTATWFADCTGDGCVGFLAGADLEMTRTGHMGQSNLWNVIDTGAPQPFPRCPWAFDLSKKPFPGLDKRAGTKALGVWYWESGFSRNPIAEDELNRDTNFLAMYGAWDCLKNVKKRYPTWKLNWAAYISGRRESRHLFGDVIITKDDIGNKRQFPDGCIPTGWDIDVHIPRKKYQHGFNGTEFISEAVYTKYEKPFWIPYRTLFSRNIENLFMAGRNISATHEALGAVRVMRTTGMMGEVVGMAAYLCRQNGTTPRGVYEACFEDLKSLMRRGIG
jgi:hypothetical protein